ncbi:MAG: bifunctional UDP-N-acetylglucosamine diphosphorylase/glucosamine-1-phosphate N-acetyltransferase GlmU [Anaerolineaceae bacterium]|nr:bifunctional UDP-N-acetylglucosamine diphosphorylase/glucosamine-1-phosphate N-acetyltransferase GlmU [Anaerolineaceae bacterium]MBN2677617.1 bifunctional UDP-N-acetylglucosamine diphosphorylase/glucosamine-1-phosphate N-acetyltransferase GlmU [Anaerolineaceae bacterium]
MKVRSIILAAGQGTRMLSQLPKMLHPLGGRPLLQYSIITSKTAVPGKPVVVVGHQADTIREIIGDDVDYAIQSEQLGTAHAVGYAEPYFQDDDDLVLVHFADMPFISPDTLSELVRIQSTNNGPVTLATVFNEDSRGFGRILRDDDNAVKAIVEETQATPEQLTIREINASVYCFRKDWLFKAIKRIQKSPKGEYYLTDTVALAREDGYSVPSFTITDPSEAMGINNRIHLAEAEAILRQRINQQWMLAGVTIQDPDTTYIEASVKLERDTTILANTHLLGTTTIGNGSLIGPNAVVRDTRIGENCRVIASFLEGAILEEGVVMGPFCHIRSGTHLAKDVHMGNFGEVKNSYIGPGSKMGHFSYIGDAQIGKDVNISAGVITCNYDGEKKHATVIGDGAFVGSDSMLVAPVRIGNRSRSGAGSVVTRDVPDDTLVVGVPAHELKKLK